MSFYEQQKRANVYLQKKFAEFLNSAQSQISADVLVYDTTMAFEVSQKYVQKRVELMVKIHSDRVKLEKDYIIKNEF
jgi:hypothetical protein